MAPAVGIIIPAMILSETQAYAFAKDGAVTIHSGLSSDLVNAAAVAVDRLFKDQEEGFFHRVLEPEILQIAQHPFILGLARELLAAPALEIADLRVRKTLPKPGARFEIEREHVDFRCSSADLASKPQRAICSFLVWLTDVGSDNCPFYFRPGSHRLVAEYTDSHPDPTGEYQQSPPTLVYADPIPIYASAGQVTLLAPTLVHAGSITPGHRNRKLLFLDYKPKGVDLRYFAQEILERQEYFRQLASLFTPENKHLLPSE